MKQIVLIFGILLIVANLLLGSMLTSYPWHTAVITSIALGIEIGLLLLVSSVRMKDAFRISLNALFPLFAFIQFITLLFVPQEGFDSICYVIAIGITLLQVLLLLAANQTSKIN